MDLRKKLPVITLVMLTAPFACKKDKDDDDKSEDFEEPNGSVSPAGGGSVPSPGGSSGHISMAADLSGAYGLLTLDSEGLGLTESSEAGGLFKIHADGKVGEVLKQEQQSAEPVSDGTVTSEPAIYMEPVSRVKSMAVSPSGQVYLHFEFPFWYQDPVSGVSSSCNLFRVRGGTYKELASSTAGPQSLECIAPDSHVLDWKITRDSVFQFDSAGNIYFPAWNNETQGQELIKVAAADASRSTIINSNIYFSDFFVTPSGGVFYIGQTHDGTSGGFFRYVTPKGPLQQIADDFWNFRFEPSLGETGDAAIFYGPDPTVDSTNPWETACLFRYDPSRYDSDLENPVSKAVSPLITCGNNMYDWLNLGRAVDEAEFGKGPYSAKNATENVTQAWVNEYVDRCTSNDTVFAGGAEIDRIHQSDSGEIFVIGSIQKKKAGLIRCNIDVWGQYCSNADNQPIAASSAAACASAGGTWTETTGYCLDDFGISDRLTCLNAGYSWEFSSAWFHDVETSFCGLASSNNGVHVVTSPSTVHQTYNVTGRQCLAADDSQDPWNLMTQYKGLAKVDAENKTLVPLMQDTSEEAVKFWFVNNIPYYLSKKSGVYRLKRYVEGGAPETLLSNFEVYHLAPSGRKNVLLFNGLDFNSNQYTFGDLDVSTKTLEENENVKSKVSSIMIFD